MSGLVSGLGPSGALLSLLVLGHVLADFAFQTSRMVARKREWPVLGQHVLVVVLVQALCLLPLFSLRAGIALAVIGLTHAVIDAVKVRRRAATEAPLRLFLVDQVAHLLVLAAIWAWMGDALVQAAWLPDLVDGVPYQAYTWLATGALVLAVIVFNHHGGNAIVAATLARFDAGKLDGGDQELAAGRLIGTLERWLVLALVLASQWSAIALVIAAKSIARFDQLRQRPFAEYYLVGTLASVLVAVVTGLATAAAI